MAINNQVLVAILAVLAVLGIVLSKYVVADGFGEHRVFALAYASIVTFVATGFLLNRRKLKNQS